MALILFFLPRMAFAQHNEAEIRTLENLEREAVLKSDTAALFHRYWSPQMVVNTPANTVGTVEGTKAGVLAGRLDYAAFERTVEKVTFHENVAVVMGQEVVKPRGQSQHAGKTVTRRFTNVWMRTKEGWSIVARQATIIAVE